MTVRTLDVGLSLDPPFCICPCSRTPSLYHRIVGSGLPPSLEHVRAVGSFSLAIGFGGVILGSPGGTENKIKKYSYSD